MLDVANARRCNTSTIQHPWRARLAYQEARGGDDTQVTIRLWATESNQVVNMGTLDVYVPVESSEWPWTEGLASTCTALKVQQR